VARVEAEREVMAVRNGREFVFAPGEPTSVEQVQLAITAPATDASRQWQGWGTALKPALEPITVGRKPIAGTVAENVLEHGTGALNVDGCRVGADGGTTRSRQAEYPKNADGTEDRSQSWARTGHGIEPINSGRWPANLIHDGSDEVVRLFPETGASSGRPRRNTAAAHNATNSMGKSVADWTTLGHDDNGGSAARFFYCAKASKSDRDEGCGGIEERDRADQSAWVRKCNVCGDTFCDPKTSRPHCGHDDFSFVSPSPRRNHHPTVKPTDLMRYLCRLVTPPGGVVLDPFTGSGSTGKGAVLEGFGFIGIEREVEYVEIAKARIGAVAKPAGGLFA
jgi:hypothetical protein